jgi:TonB family protein
MSRPDPFEDSDDDEPLFALENDPRQSDVGHLASKLASHMDGASSADLALDLVLNEIVQQARLATTAAGAAIALFRNEEMVCRAASGDGAPDLGTRLDARSGLSGACVRTRKIQRCDDMLNDPRVHAEALEGVDVRSILIVPVLSGSDLVGIFEILSPRPSAFGDRDVLTLEALSRRIVKNVERIAESPSPATTLPATVIPRTMSLTPEAAPEFIVPEAAEIVPPAAETVPAARDYWTMVLTAVVIALALLLGWMVGYAGWQRAMGGRSMPAVAAVSPPSSANAQAAGSKPTAAPATVGKDKKQTTSARPKAESDTSAGGLVVYQNGKIIFQQPPEESAASTVKTAGGADSANLMSIAPDVADTYLLNRIEPAYPEAAKQSQALGPVILEIRVGKDGAVQQANLVSGDSLLVPAAVAAVRQWKYQPYSPNGNPQDFLTRVTVNFQAP